MTRFRVVIAARAERQIAAAVTWWRDHRLAAPELLLAEVAEAFELVAIAPRAGVPYAYRGRAANVRRVLLPRTRYHLYYTVDEPARVVTIRVLWHAARGRGPAL